MALRRQVKNVVKNFSDIEVKVREATSNDPWGPSSSLTSEIADATYNGQAFPAIMTLLWKRINDHGKNWRHVYKSLVVLEYIVKTGSEKVAQQCKENIFSIKTLKDFQFIDKDGKDQGINVREKSKLLVALLKDEERLKSERQRALKAKERFSQSQGGIGNTSFPKNQRFQGSSKYPEARVSQDDSNLPPPKQHDTDRNADSRSTDGRIDSDIEKVRPSNEAEEEMQLQIALAMSREEAEKDTRTQDVEDQIFAKTPNAPPLAHSTLLNLTDTTMAPSQNNSNPWESAPQQAPIQQPQPSDPWGSSSSTQPSSDPWGGPSQVQTIAPPISDPWGTSNSSPAPTSVPVQMYPSMPSSMAIQSSSTSNDPWGIPSSSNPPPDPFALQHHPAPVSLEFNSQPLQPLSGTTSNDIFGDPLTNDLSKPTSSSSFLSNGSHLVDVDNIMTKSSENSTLANPFMSTSTTNPFMQDKPKPKSINELRHDKTNTFVQPGGSNGMLLPTPMQPSQNNPFL